MTSVNPFISIIIPVRNGVKTIEKCLQSIYSLKYKNYEVIIINDGSADETGTVLENHKNKINIITTNGVGASKARNLGIKEAKGEFIAFTDADCIVSNTWLENLLECFSKGENIAGGGGNQLSPADETYFGKILTEFMKSISFIIDYVKNEKNKIIFTNHNASCNAIYKKNVLDKVGYFMEGLWPGEDVDLDYRIINAGYLLAYNPEAVVYHYRPDNIEKFIKMMFNYGRVQAVLVKKYGFFRIIHFEPFAFLFFTSCVFFVINKPVYLAVVFLFVISAAFMYFFYKAKNIKKTCYFLYLGVITVLFWNAGFFKGAFNLRDK